MLSYYKQPNIQLPTNLQIKLVFNGENLVVTKADLQHVNHATTQQVYDHYPENMRLKEDEETEVRNMIKVGGSKKLIKSHIEKKRETPVPIKLLHNLQTKMNAAVEGPSENPLENLHASLSLVPNVRVRFISNQNDELVGKWIIYINNYSEIDNSFCTNF